MKRIIKLFYINKLHSNHKLERNTRDLIHTYTQGHNGRKRE